VLRALAGRCVDRERDAYLVQPRAERIVAAGRPADEAPVVDGKLVAAGRRLAFGDYLQRADELYRRLERQRQGFVCLRLPTLSLVIYNEPIDGGRAQRYP
jgi:hypothetical protein